MFLREEAQQIIDEYLPYSGGCAFCGGPDWRHRILDSIRESYDAGDPIDTLVDEYCFPKQFIEAAIALKQNGKSIK